MNQLSPEELRQHLSAPFQDADIEWRVSATNKEKTRGLAVPYVTNRAIMNRLDATVGVDGWRNEFTPWQNDSQNKKGAQLCTIYIYFPELQQWIPKTDGAENSDIEPVKGGLSDSMKRAAVQWTIGRYLYGMPQVWVSLNDRAAIADGERYQLDKAHAEWVQKVQGRQQTAAAPTATAPPKQAAAPQPVPRPPQPAPPSAPPRPEQRCYQVTAAVIRPAINGGQNTSVQLADASGSSVQAFVQGVDPALTPGVWLTGVTLTQKTKGGVVFHTLDAYHIEAGQQAA